MGPPPEVDCVVLLLASGRMQTGHGVIYGRQRPQASSFKLLSGSREEGDWRFSEATLLRTAGRSLGPPAQAHYRARLPVSTCRNPVVPDGRFFSILPCFPNVPEGPIAPIQTIAR